MEVVGYLINWDKALKLRAEGKLRTATWEDYTAEFQRYTEDGWATDSAVLYQTIGPALCRLSAGFE